MALFFDQAWFEARLAERGMDRDVLAAACGLTRGAIELIFKDQREISAGEVAALAQALGQTPEAVALHAGVSTPVPVSGGPGRDDAAALAQRIAALEARVAVLEAALKSRSW